MHSQFQQLNFEPLLFDNVTLPKAMFSLVIYCGALLLIYEGWNWSRFGHFYSNIWKAYLNWTLEFHGRWSKCVLLLLGDNSAIFTWTGQGLETTLFIRSQRKEYLGLEWCQIKFQILSCCTSSVFWKCTNITLEQMYFSFKLFKCCKVFDVCGKWRKHLWIKD